MIKNDFEYFDDWVEFTYNYVGITKDKIILIDNFDDVCWEFVSQSGNKFIRKCGNSEKSYRAGRLKFGKYMLTPERKQELTTIINRQLLPFV